eukprot:6724835-Pyramimonas_sp.AAC.1
MSKSAGGSMSSKSRLGAGVGEQQALLLSTSRSPTYNRDGAQTNVDSNGEPAGNGPGGGPAVSGPQGSADRSRSLYA